MRLLRLSDISMNMTLRLADLYIQKAVLFKDSDEAFFNTVTVSGSSIDISPSMCEID